MLEKFNTMISIAFIVFSAGCSNQGYSVLASTGTVIGVEVSENPATQFPQAKLGYNRAELAFVPSNRNGEKNPTGSYGKGATDVADVLMELRYGDIFDTGSSSIYQRLAVGSKAVEQPGASVMFAKNAEGSLDKDAEAALKAVQSTPTVFEPNEKLKSTMTKKFIECRDVTQDINCIKKFDTAVKTVDSKYSDYGGFSSDNDVSLDTIKKVCELLNKQGESFICN